MLQPHVLFESTVETILVVDDVPTNREVLASLLDARGYRVLLAEDGARGLELATRTPSPDLVLLDVQMPDLDGYEVLRRLRSAPMTAAIPVVFLTSHDDPASEAHALALGADDFVIKPPQPDRLLARVRVHLDAARVRRELIEQNLLLVAEAQRYASEQEVAQMVTIRALAHLAETRDPETGNHILRTQAYVRTLALELRRDPAYAQRLDGRTIELLAMSAPLHDIGKVGIPDQILLKPGKLDAAEWAVMKTHAAIGARAIEMAEHDIGHRVDFLTTAKEIAHWHHERWDGTGYPDGLAGEAIPISARLMALADVFDALISPRVYKAPMSCEAARAIILQGRGSHFDPAVADAFERQFERFVEIARRYSDVEPETEAVAQAA